MKNISLYSEKNMSGFSVNTQHQNNPHHSALLKTGDSVGMSLAITVLGIIIVAVSIFVFIKKQKNK